MNSDEILDALEDTREQFLDCIEGLSENEMQLPGVVGEWSVKDIIAHLSSWEAELVKLLWQAAQGLPPTTAFFTQSSVDETNAAWQKTMKDRPLDKVLADFAAVRKQTIRRLEAFSDDQLNNPRRYTWQRQTPLWEWIANNTFSHEAEHMQQIQLWRSKLGL